jgi:hypothetical protein
MCTTVGLQSWHHRELENGKIHFVVVVCCCVVITRGSRRVSECSFMNDKRRKGTRAKNQRQFQADASGGKSQSTGGLLCCNHERIEESVRVFIHERQT